MSKSEEIKVAKIRHSMVVLSVSLLVIGMIIVTALIQAGSILRTPIDVGISGSAECDATTDGNIQFDGRQVNLTGSVEKGQWIAVSPTNKTWMPGWYYPLTDRVPVGLVNVPDFKQFKVTHLQGGCKAQGTISGNMPLWAFIVLQNEARS